MIAAACLLLALAALPVSAAPADPEAADPTPADSVPAAPAAPAPADLASADDDSAAADTTSDPAAAGPPRAATGARLFETWDLGVDAGVLVPAGPLARVLDPAPQLGFRLLSSYYGPWRAWASIDLARLDGAASPVAVGMATGTAGLAWQPPSAWIPSPGIGLAYHYARALGKADGADEYLFLEDGESEFGSRTSLRWGFPLGKRLALSAGARWEAMFTAPEYGHAFAIHLGAAWTRR